MKTHRCPYCLTEETISWGMYKGRKRFKCNHCDRTFTLKTHSIDNGIRKGNEFKKCKEMMLDGIILSNKMMGKLLKVSERTAFEWRHKILSSLNVEFSKFSSEVEVDDVFIKYSRKGRRHVQSPVARTRGKANYIPSGDSDYQAKVFFMYDRKSKSLDLQLVRVGRLKADDVKECLENKLCKKAIIYSDKHPSIKSYTKQNKIKHFVFEAKKHTDKNVHVQHINAYAGDFDDMINDKLKGVSTKYLINYANWFKALKNKKVKTVKSWFDFIKIEESYKSFIETKSNFVFECLVSPEFKQQLWATNLYN